jgi:hypothetical protein
MSGDKNNDVLIQAVLEIGRNMQEMNKDIHNMGTEINNKMIQLIEANKLKEAEQDKRIDNIEKLAPLQPVANIIRNQKFIIFGMILVLGLTGLSFTQLIINTVNRATGLDQVLEIEKKNTATLKRLCAYLKLECN